MQEFVVFHGADAIRQAARGVARQDAPRRAAEAFNAALGSPAKKAISMNCLRSAQPADPKGPWGLLGLVRSLAGRVRAANMCLLWRQGAQGGVRYG